MSYGSAKSSGSVSESMSSSGSSDSSGSSGGEEYSSSGGMPYSEESMASSSASSSACDCAFELADVMVHDDTGYDDVAIAKLRIVNTGTCVLELLEYINSFDADEYIINDNPDHGAAEILIPPGNWATLELQRYGVEDIPAQSFTGETLGLYLGCDDGTQLDRFLTWPAENF